MNIVNNKKGFTLMEMTVSIAIMVLLISLFLANYRTGMKKSELTLATQNVVSNLRFAQGASLGSVNYSSLPPVGGWGVHFDTTSGNNTSYIIFADVNGNHAYDGASEAVPASGGRTVRLPSNIFLESIKYQGVTSKTWADFIFLPPDPETVIWDGSATTTYAVIRFKHLLTGDYWDVIANIYGLIEVNHAGS